MPKRPSARSTKAEILNEFDVLFEENKKLMTQVQQLEKEKKTLEKQVIRDVEEPKPAKKEAKEPVKEKEIDISKLNTMDKIIDNLKAIRSGFGKAVNEVSAKLVSEASTLAELLRNIEDEALQLKTLYDLELTGDTLNELMQQYLEKSNLFEKEAHQHLQSFEQEMIEKQKAWQKEQDEHAQSIKERNGNAELDFQRDEAEYKYNLELQRKLENEEFQLKLRKLQKELETIESEKKKEWAEREKILAEQEKEFNDLKKRVDNFPKELEAAIRDAKTKASQMARIETEKKADLRAKEVEGEKRVFELKIKSLEDIVKTQVQQVQSLATKLDATLKQAQALAIKAIEGASHVSSFESVKEIAMEQAKKIKSE